MVDSVSVRLKNARVKKNAFKHSYTMECGNRLRVGVRAKNRVFLNLWFGEPVVCTLDSCGFRNFRGFRDFCESSAQLLVCSCLSCLCHFVVFVISVVFVKGDSHANHSRGPENGAFGKPCFCPARNRGFLTKMAKMTNLHSNQ